MYFEERLLILLAGDAIFYYGLEAARVCLDLPLGYELFLNFAYPSDYDFLILTIGIGVCLFVAFLADSYCGRLPIVFAGLALLLVSMICHSVSLFVFEGDNNYLMIASVYLFLLYMTTSSVRNVLHLEQIIMPTNFMFLRHYIFWTTFLRLIVMFIFNVVAYCIGAVKNLLFLKIHSLVNVGLTIAYATLLIYFYHARRLLIERIRKGIWIKSFKCFMNAILPKGRSEWESEISREQHRLVRQQRSSMAKPIRRDFTRYSQAFPNPPPRHSIARASTARASQARFSQAGYPQTFFAPVRHSQAIPSPKGQRPYAYYIYFEPDEEKAGVKPTSDPTRGRGRGTLPSSLKPPRPRPPPPPTPARPQPPPPQPVLQKLRFTHDDPSKIKAPEELSKPPSVKSLPSVKPPPPIEKKVKIEGKSTVQDSQSDDKKLDGADTSYLGGYFGAAKRNPNMQAEPEIRALKTGSAELGGKKLTDDMDRKRYLPSWLLWKKDKDKPDGMDEYYELQHHWISRASNKSTLSIMEETRRFWVVQFIFLTSFIFNVSSYFILIFTMVQERICKQTDVNFIDNLHISVYYSFFKVILFPFCEYVIIPFFKRMKIFYTDLQVVGFALFILLLALLTGLIIHLELETSIQYIPSIHFSQIRMYNSLPITVTVASLKFGFLKILPEQIKLIPNIQGSKSFNLTVKVSNQEGSLDVVESVQLSVLRTFSFVITDRGLVANSNKPDPTIFTKQRSDSIASYFIICEEELNGSLIFTDVKSSGSQTRDIPLRGEQVVIFPGQYAIKLKSGKSRLTITDNYQMQPGGLYGIFIYNGTAKIFPAEGPPPLYFAILLIQIILLCLAQALVTVSFFKFLFFESSPKLRCTIFSNVYMFGLVAVAIASSDSVLAYYATFSRVIVVVLVIHVVGTALSIYSYSYYEFNTPYLK